MHEEVVFKTSLSDQTANIIKNLSIIFRHGMSEITDQNYYTILMVASVSH